MPATEAAHENETDVDDLIAYARHHGERAGIALSRTRPVGGWDEEAPRVVSIDEKNVALLEAIQQTEKVLSFLRLAADQVHEQLVEPA